MAASDWLPDFLRARLQGRGTVRRALDNSAWLFFDQLLRMVGGLMVGVWLARYLGPAHFGLLSYARAALSGWWAPIVIRYERGAGARLGA